MKKENGGKSNTTDKRVKTDRPVQIWKKAKKSGFPSPRNADPKGEKGAIPLHKEKK